MKWLIGALGGFVTYILDFLTKRLGIKGILTAFFIVVGGAFVAFMTSFFVFISLYIMRLWNTLKDILPKLADYSASASGSFGGLSNSTMLSSAMEFLHVSGLAPAFSASMQLFIALLSLYFMVQAYKLMAYVYQNIGAVIATLLTLLNR